MRTLKDHLPHEFVGGEYMDTPSYKLRDIEVTAAYDNRDKPWPGPQKNVTAWYVLVNGFAVAWNENVHKGWSFPVIKYVGDNEVTFQSKRTTEIKAMTTNEKTEKLLAMAATTYGAPDEIYLSEAAQLIRAGRIVRRIVYSKAGGNPKFRLFLAAA